MRRWQTVHQSAHSLLQNYVKSLLSQKSGIADLTITATEVALEGLFRIVWSQ